MPGPRYVSEVNRTSVGRTTAGPKRTPRRALFAPAVASTVGVELAPVSTIEMWLLVVAPKVVAYNFAPLVPAPQVACALKSTVNPTAPLVSPVGGARVDRKSTRLNSSHLGISY